MSAKNGVRIQAVWSQLLEAGPASREAFSAAVCGTFVAAVSCPNHRVFSDAQIARLFEAALTDVFSLTHPGGNGI